MSKKSIYVSPSVESVSVDADVIVCAISGGSGAVRPGGGDPVAPPDEDEESF